MTDRVELQVEIEAERAAVFGLVATAEGLRSWLDGAELEPRVGGPVRLQLRDSEVTGKVVALDPPQHISFTWQWVDEPAAPPSIVAFDVIDHGDRAHLTIRQVGLRDRQQVELHEELWRHWLDRLVNAARLLPKEIETTHA
jgi:uncharacterized protein YndB with AHSA1/START domain